MMKALHRPSICLGLIPLLFLSASSTLLAQRTIVATQSVGTPVVIQGGTLPPGAVVVPPGGPGQPPGVSAPGGPQPGGQPPAMGPDGKPIPPGGANPPGGKSPEGQGTGGPSEPIKRTSKPPEPPNKKEFEVRPDEKGMVQFQFRNQSWPDLLRWLAETSNLSLDWQELPNDYLNIATQRKQSLEETRDQFNRHLLARGFTMLELDGMIQVVKTAGINVSLVPKVPPDALESLPPNRFVRTSFTLTTLIAKEAAVEFKPLVSSNGTLNPLESTNRLEAMDSAGNLLEIYRILQEEQSEEAQESLAREFELEFVRANDAREQIISFLGLENKTNRAASGRMSQQELMMQQQEMQMRMQQQQMQQQQGGKPPAAAANNEIYVVANVRRNSVIAHAPPDKMAIISAFLKRIDVPNENSASLQSIETRMKIYRLMSLDPKQFVTSMMAMDALEPTTKLEVDEKNRAIIAYASLSDQLIIQQTLDRLDGSARDFEVIQLRRLRAEDVAGTIKFLMGKEEPKQDDRNRRMFFDPFGGFSRPQEPTNDDSFRVGANSQDNQLLLWANEVEIKEVNKLLVKLGEIPPQGLQRSRVRTIDASRSPETKEYLKRLQEAWSKVSPNPLVLPEDTEFETKDAVNMPPEPTSDSKGTETAKGTETDSEKASEAPAEKEGSEEKGAKKSNADVTRSERQSSEVPGGRLSLHQDGSDNPTPADVKKNSGDEAAGSKGASTTAETSPADAIRLQFDERGNLILTGDDLDALDRLEQMMLANAPPLKRYEVFYIQNARPSWVELNLKDYFKDEEQEQDSNPFAFIFGFDPGTTRKSEDPQLGKKRQLRFISDIDTRSIIVIGADEQQLKTIRSLIKLWDVPEKTNRQKLRFTKLVRIEHSRAESIVEAIKDAYRDLLSTNDKAFSKGAGGNKESKHEESTETVSDSGGLNFSFTGRLSMGIDRVTNSVIVSAEGEDLLKLVIEMIKELDQAAQPSGAVQMIQLGGTNSEAMERALKALISPKDDKRAPQQPGMEGQQPPNMPNQFQPPESQGNAKGRSRRNG